MLKTLRLRHLATLAVMASFVLFFRPPPADAAVAEVTSMMTVDVRGACARLFGNHRARRRRVEAARAGTEAKTRIRLGYVPSIEVIAERNALLTQFDVTARDAADVEIGRMPAYLLTPYQLSLGDVTVDEDARDKGVATLMFAALLERAPHVVRVQSVLTGTNAELVRAAVAAGTPCREAVLNSPAGRMRARFGFTKLIGEPDCRADGIRFRVDRRARRLL